MKDLHKKGFSTRAVHSGERKSRGEWTPVATPIYSTVGYLYESMNDLDAVFDGGKAGYVYTRYENPTVRAFEEVMAELEGGEAAQAYGSGMAAVHAALLGAGLRAGTTVVTTLDLYGATTALLRKLFAEMGVTIRLVDATDTEAVEAALAETHPAALLVETISNPLMKIADAPSLAVLAHRYGAQLLVANTFASPCLFNPIPHGADYAIHSVTKYIGGHGDVTGGVVVTSSENRRKLNEWNKLVGGILGPFEAWLAL
ncbi:MAG: PLP-dependent transferase, partial [Deltaproteobacteria bacterium]